jgi:3-phenylpropionate/trans-cinnamate dioxygenase ferredoxin reductase subunit
VHLRPAGFYEKQGVEVVSGERVEEVDRAAHRVRLGSGRTLDYEHLVLALGARPRALHVPGAELDGVMTLRTVEDAAALRGRLAQARDVVVIGGGFIGLEVAAAARGRGARVTVVEALERPLARVVSPEISAFYVARHEAAGATVLLRTGVQALEGADGRVRRVVLADGRRLPADLVVVGIGIVPVTDLAEAAGLVVDDGVVVDAHLRTSDPAIWAVGDCARYPSAHAGGRVRLESVQNAVDHGRCAAAGIAGAPEPYAALPWFWSDQHGTKLQIAGLTAGREAAVVRGEPEEGAFSVFCFAGGRLIGVESVNRLQEHMAARRLLEAGGSVTPEQAADPGFDLKAHAAGG